MNKLIRTILILMPFTAVIGMILILTLINAKLLYWLNWYSISPVIEKIIAVGAGFIYAIGSTAIIIWFNPKFLSDNNKNLNWRIAGSNFLKLVFVLLDGIHIMIFFNNNNSKQFTNDIASTVYGIQTMLILFFIGSVIDKIIRNLQAKEDEKKVTIEDIEEKQSEINSIESEFKLSLDEIKLHQSKIEEQQSELSDRDEHILFLESHFYKNERSRILKKKDENRTDEEIEKLKESEKYL